MNILHLLEHDVNQLLVDKFHQRFAFRFLSLQPLCSLSELFGMKSSVLIVYFGFPKLHHMKYVPLYILSRMEELFGANNFFKPYIRGQEIIKMLSLDFKSILAFPYMSKNLVSL